MLDIEIVTSCLISDQYHSSTWIMLTEFVGNWRLWYCCLTDIHISTCILPSTVVGTTTCIKKLDCNSPTVPFYTVYTSRCCPLVITNQACDSLVIADWPCTLQMLVVLIITVNVMVMVAFTLTKYWFLWQLLGRIWPSVLWRCWLGGRKGIRPVKELSGEVLAWLSVWCEVQTCTCPADATATHYFLLQ